jgi:hypothetical protein
MHIIIFWYTINEPKISPCPRPCKMFHHIVSFYSEELYRLKVFQNRVLRKIVGPNRDELTGQWRRLYNKELYDLYSSQNIIQVIKSG